MVVRKWGGGKVVSYFIFDTTKPNSVTQAFGRRVTDRE
jgi:hypothetical protein